MKTQSQSEQRAYEVQEFCGAYRISRSTFYKLVKDGNGPKLTKVGKKTLIAADAAERWFKTMQS